MGLVNFVFRGVFIVIMGEYVEVFKKVNMFFLKFKILKCFLFKNQKFILFLLFVYLIWYYLGFESVI